MPVNVLVIDRAPPVSDSQGNELIARQVFRRLRRDHRLTLVAPVAVGGEETARAAIDGLFDDIVLVPGAGRLTSLGGWVETTIGRSRLPMAGAVRGGTAARLATRIRRALATGRFDVAHVRQLPMAPYRADLGGLPSLLELVDSEGLASSRAIGGGVRGALRRAVAGRVEGLAVRGAPLVTTVAEADAAAIRRMRPDVRVEVVPNGVDVDWFRPRPDAPTRPESVVFVGAMSFPPNVAAVTWFVDDVLPLLRASRPSITFTIVGRDPAPAVRALTGTPGVEVTGSVDDVRPYLAGSAIVVAPLVSGSGIKNKVLEAMAMARPVVATPLAVEGLTAVADRDVAVGATPATFAAAVLALLDDPTRAARIAAAGRALVESTYTWDACARRYAEIYAELAATRGARR